MSHPPIPPKSRYFDPHGWVDLWSFTGAAITIPLTRLNDAPPHVKGIISAVAEVEWRKRAERWMKIHEWRHFHILGPKWKEPEIDNDCGCLRAPFQLETNAWRMSEASIAIAEQWRAWGESK